MITNDDDTNRRAANRSKAKDVYEFLDSLRESGVTNMYGGAAYIELHFGFTEKVATEWLLKWMKSFSDRHPTIITEGE